MKITKSQLKQIIVEELRDYYGGESHPQSERDAAQPRRPEADSFSGHLSLSNSIRDAIIGHLENEKFFEMGAIPQSVIRVIENSSVRISDAVEGMD
jgi:hypothetical protein